MLQTVWQSVGPRAPQCVFRNLPSSGRFRSDVPVSDTRLRINVTARYLLYLQNVK